jgi:hypothetical protein
MTDAFTQIWKIHREKGVPVRGAPGVVCGAGGRGRGAGAECRARAHARARASAQPPPSRRTPLQHLPAAPATPLTCPPKQLRVAAFIKALHEVTRAELHRGFD